MHCVRGLSDAYKVKVYGLFLAFVYFTPILGVETKAFPHFCEK
jgi:hypothetical protein